jgi:plasmid stability protein
MTTRSLRIPDDLDAALAMAAGIHRQSLNAEILAAIRAHVQRVAMSPKGAGLAALLSATDARKKAAR